MKQNSLDANVDSVFFDIKATERMDFNGEQLYVCRATERMQSNWKGEHGVGLIHTQYILGINKLNESIAQLILNEQQY